jgi:chromosome segregation ATPase
MSNINFSRDIPFSSTRRNNEEAEWEDYKSSGSTKARKGKKWSEGENNDLLDQVKRGLSHAEIAKIHGRSDKAIKMHLEEMALSMKEQKIDLEDIKEQLKLKDEDLNTAEKRAKAREDNNSVNLAEKIQSLENKIDTLNVIINSQNRGIEELKKMVEILLNRE